MAEQLTSDVACSRIALGVEYDGSVFNGWQTQLNPHLRTVQETLEQALSRIAAAPVTVICAGRTDAGVHASGQVVHFDTAVARPLKAWLHGTNTHLGSHVCVRWAHAVPADFHARFSAQSRRYRYLISNAPVRPALYGSFVTHHHAPLDADRMHKAGQALLGEQDFTSFRATGCQSRTPMRNVTSLSVQRRGDLVVVDIEANAFLLHMVRNIVGTLLVIGQGDRPPGWAGELLALRDRTQAAPTAAPQGLCLVAVRYPLVYAMPATASPIWP